MRHDRLRDMTNGAVRRARPDMVGLQFSSPGRTDKQQDNARMWKEVETAAVALGCFKAEHGRWPSDLTELSPSLLKVIPKDRFSGGMLLYRTGKQGYLLYSIGLNRRDDGGVWEHTTGKDDIAAKVVSGP